MAEVGRVDDGYRSSDDEDYMPSAGSDDEVEVVVEAGTAAAVTAGAGPGANGLRKKKQKRKRKRNVDALDEDEKLLKRRGVGMSEETRKLAEAMRAEEEAARLANEVKASSARKATVDDLWAELNGGSKSKAAAPRKTSSAAAAARAPAAAAPPPSRAATKARPSLQEIMAGKTSRTTSRKPGVVALTEEFDFAGTTVAVTKEVAANSTEARRAQKSNRVDALLSKLKGKKKMTVGLKTALDWNSFKESNNLAAELEAKRKDAYLERQDFLQRTDERLFEKEKAQRQTERLKLEAELAALKRR
ncbi:uncharacterized protein AMSG_04468 [Thecamonas trahens ATCC 50062]|uniref:BCNT-C domain-containing protein n=1 Tax=Thecamonas trahens ATCC 50062 TaxID=461836 RepID=A0A0L0D780_THETB|nr:hypothetical protein AMSG_04468 [Thecamonas trahens ATCC 50062]KNC48237.1 hypothetical protein AMSG_04468 [Thecamonas trahens ATCC 50062]|eukprot:XP_013758806.1 hypothetical protein AMSG_04468 [Thecamonas trahens ATCC 50062]